MLLLEQESLQEVILKKPQTLAQH